MSAVHAVRRIVQRRGRLCAAPILAVALTAVAFSPALAGCYKTDNGIQAPTNRMYFPVGLAVSTEGSALYVVNSDYDLQYNSGTLQAYDLAALRKAGARPKGDAVGDADCPWDIASGQRRCASERFSRASVFIGAFSTELQLSRSTFGKPSARSRRLFAPTRGDAAVSWVNVGEDGIGDPFALTCELSGDRCSDRHRTGNNPDEAGNTRKITMPGEPFGLAQSLDGSALLVTHQTSDRVSLLDTGLPKLSALIANPDADQVERSPSLQFVLEKVAVGGVGVVPVPHDAAAHPDDVAPRAAFLTTSRAAAELTLLRYFDDDGSASAEGGVGSTVRRPFVVKERTIAVSGNAGGSDSRGIVIDDSPRIACRVQVLAAALPPAAGAPAGPSAATQRELVRCARLPARMFVANRSPASLLIGEVGERTTAVAGPYDDDRVTFTGSIPLPAGPSRVYVAPIVDVDGAYALRVFVACYDAGILYAIDPETSRVESIINVGTGPYAMAFDPYNVELAAVHGIAANDLHGGSAYRFGYLASFTESYVQAIDLSRPSTEPGKLATFEQVLFTLGTPTKPKGAK
jgi:YVTN family beta-propeller protein